LREGRLGALELGDLTILLRLEHADLREDHGIANAGGRLRHEDTLHIPATGQLR
jgi:hypothetical protein